MSTSDLNHTLDEGVGRLQDGLDTVFGGPGVACLRRCACKRVRQASDVASDLVVDQPLAVIGVAVLVGFLIGALLRRRKMNPA